MFQLIVFAHVIFIHGGKIYCLEGDVMKLFTSTSGYKFANNSFYYMENTVSSTNKCGMKCLDSAYCASFSYKNVSGRCLISSLFANDIGALATEPALSHYQYRLSAFPVNLTLSWRYQPRVIATPDFPYVKLFNSSFFVRLLVPHGYTINLLFITVSIDEPNCNRTQEGVTIDHGSIVLTQALHLCDQRKINTPFIFSSEENIIQIRAKSSTSRIMFKARYYFVKFGNKSTNCDLLTCPVNRDCKRTGRTLSCECFEGYIGKHCTFDPCFLNPCHNNGSCININGNVKCSCGDMFTGKYCEISLDPCSSKPCIMGKCQLKNNTSYYCECTAGYTGINCETNIDECASNPCSGSECIDGINQYYCKCPQCTHGLCLYKDSTPFCWCFPGFTGVNCSHDRNECSSNPCVHGNCTDYIDGYQCKCESGYHGWDCDHYNPVKCQDNYCVNGDCIEYNPGNMTCVCPHGLTGNYCEKMMNQCSDQCLKYCMESINNANTKTCFQKCAVFCDHKIITKNHSLDNKTTVVPTTSIRRSTIYTEVNTCPSTCINGQCIYNNGSFICKCYHGFSGVNCDNIIPSCPCVHGSCLNNVTTRCVCEHSYTGLYCDIELTVSSCNENQCVHGQCKKEICVCEHQYTGKRCELLLDTTNVKCGSIPSDRNDENNASTTNGFTWLVIIVVVLFILLLVLGTIFISTRCTHQRGSINFEQIRNHHQESSSKLLYSKGVNTERLNRNYLTAISTPPQEQRRAVLNQAYNSSRLDEGRDSDIHLNYENNSNQSFRPFTVCQSQNSDVISQYEQTQASENSFSISSTNTDLYDFPPSPNRRHITIEEIQNSTTHWIEGVETCKSEV